MFATAGDRERKLTPQGRQTRLSSGILRGLLLGVASLTFTPAGGAEPGLVAVLFVDRSPYAEAARALAGSVRAAGTPCELIPLASGEESEAKKVLQGLRQRSPALLATAGPQLTDAALRELPQTRIVHFMVPNVLDAPFVRGPPAAGRLTGVTCDIAPAEQVRWIRRSNPAARKVAVLCSERTRQTGAALVAAGKEAGLELVMLTAQSDKFAEVTTRLDQVGVDGVLMIPDAQVYNAVNVQHLLLWGMRQGHSVWAFSDKIVKAGALAGVYCDPEDVGREAAELALALLRGGPEPRGGVRYPARPRYGLNLHAARMLKLDVDEIVRDDRVERFGGTP